MVQINKDNSEINEEWDRCDQKLLRLGSEETDFGMPTV